MKGLATAVGAATGGVLSFWLCVSLNLIFLCDRDNGVPGAFAMAVAGCLWGSMFAAVAGILAVYFPRKNS